MPALLGRLLRYRWGDDLVTFAADEVPESLHDAFPLSRREWASAVAARSTGPDALSDGIDTGEILITVVSGGIVYRSLGPLFRLSDSDRYWVHMAGAPWGVGYGLEFAVEEVLSVVAVEPATRPAEMSGVRVVPTLLEACTSDPHPSFGAEHNFVVLHEKAGNVQLVQGSLRRCLGSPEWAIRATGGTYLVTVLARALEVLPARSWFWLEVFEALRDRTGGSALMCYRQSTDRGSVVRDLMGTVVGLDLDDEEPHITLAEISPEGLLRVRLRLDQIVELSVGAPVDRGGIRTGGVSPGELPVPEVTRSQALEQIVDGGSYALLWQPHPYVFTQVQLRDVHRDGDRICGVGGDGEPAEFPRAEILAAQDLHASPERILVEKLAWWSLLSDLLHPMREHTGTLLWLNGDALVVTEQVGYRGTDDGSNFRFRSLDGALELPADDIVGFVSDDVL